MSNPTPSTINADPFGVATAGIPAIGTVPSAQPTAAPVAPTQQAAPAKISPSARGKAALDHALALANSGHAAYVLARDNPAANFEMLAKRGFKLSVGAPARKAFALSWSEPCCQIEWGAAAQSLKWCSTTWEKDREFYDRGLGQQVSYKAGDVRPQSLAPPTFQPFDNPLILMTDDDFGLDVDFPVEIGLKLPETFNSFDELANVLRAHTGFRVLWDCMETQNPGSAMSWLQGCIVQKTGLKGYSIITRKALGDGLGQATGFLATQWDGQLPEGYTDADRHKLVCTIDTRDAAAGLFFGPGTVVAIDEKAAGKGALVLTDRYYKLVSGGNLTKSTLAYLSPAASALILSTKPASSPANGSTDFKARTVPLGPDPLGPRPDYGIASAGEASLAVRALSKQDPIELLAKHIFYIKAINKAVKSGAPYPFSDRSQWLEQIMFPWAHLEARDLGVLPGEGIFCFDAVCRADDRYDAGVAASADDHGQYTKAVESAKSRHDSECDTYETIHKLANENKWAARNALRKEAQAAAQAAAPALFQRVALDKANAEAERAQALRAIEEGKSGVKPDAVAVERHVDTVLAGQDAKPTDDMDSAHIPPVEELPIPQGAPFLDPQALIPLETAAARFTFIQNYGGKDAVFDTMNPDNIVGWDSFAKTRQEKVTLAEGGSAVMGKLMAHDPTARITADQMEFLPGRRRGVVIHNGLRTLNMFGGYPIENYLSANVHMVMSAAEAEAKSRMILRFLFEVVAQGDREFYNYIFCWLAWKIQYPHLQTQVAPVFLGEQGSGKSAFFQLLKAMFGRYARSFNRPSALFHDFNAFLQTVLIAWLEEGTNTTQSKYDDMSKDLITYDEMMVNRKGYGQIFVPNNLTLGFNTNRVHAVQADGDARRLVIQRIDRVWTKNGPEWEAFFTDIKGHKNNSNVRPGLGIGALAFWQYMKSVPLGDFHPAKDIIGTAAKAEQKKLSEGITVKGFIWHMLEQAKIKGMHPDTPWRAGPVTLDKNDMDGLIAEAMKWRTDKMKETGKRKVPEFSTKGVSMALAKHIGVTNTRSNSVTTWTLPAYNTALDQFEAVNDCVGSVKK